MFRRDRWLGVISALGVLFAAGCAGAAGSPVPAPDPTATVEVGTAAATTTLTPTPSPTPIRTAAAATPTHQSSPTPTPTPTPEPTATPTPVPTEVPSLTSLELGEGSQARYRVREQFADQNFPNDAVGETSDVSGAIVLEGPGSVLPRESVLVVDLRTLRSDDPDRDDYLRGESLESDRYPFAEFRVQEVPGLPWPLPQKGEATFQVLGDMTLHNYTRPLTWDVTARFAPDQIIGTARTNFTFSTFHMVRPSRFFLLSVEDNIRLELDFVLSVREMDAGSSEGP